MTPYVTNHAVDQASIRCIDLWRRKQNPGEGLMTWLQREAIEALKATPDHEGRHAHAGLLWVFGWDKHKPVLITVIPGGK